MAENTTTTTLPQELKPQGTSITPKVVFVRHAGAALPVVPTSSPSAPSKYTPQLHASKKRGRPLKPKEQQLQLPPGYNALRRGKTVFSNELGEEFIEAYYNAGASLTRACRKLGVSFSAALQWRDKIPHFAAGLKEVEEIIKDEIHSQFMERVLHTWEPNPAWKFKYFNRFFPEYTAQKKVEKVIFNLTDSLMKPAMVVEGEVVKPTEIGAGDATGPKSPMDAPSHTTQVS